jgi:iron-sulfur cluster repair protein YtfE (RIC family)
MRREKAAKKAPGDHLVADLKWIHGVLRRDIQVLQDLAAETSSGVSPARVQKVIKGLQTQSPLWQLRVNCVRYCQLVHSHHGNEDVSLFPALRRANPALTPAVNRLVADHRRVSDLLDQVESLANLLKTDDGTDTRARLAAALKELGTHLLAHLDFEEETIIPTLRQWSQWPTR